MSSGMNLGQEQAGRVQSVRAQSQYARAWLARDSLDVPVPEIIILST